MYCHISLQNYRRSEQGVDTLTLDLDRKASWKERSRASSQSSYFSSKAVREEGTQKSAFILWYLLGERDRHIFWDMIYIEKKEEWSQEVT